MKRRGHKGIHESGEMYLEAILVLSQKTGYVRSVDVGEYLGYSKPSVSRAMGILKKGGFVSVARDGEITLNEPGRKIAEMIYERHTFLSKFLMLCGVPEDVATADACKLEHSISDVSFQALKKYVREYLVDENGAIRQDIEASEE